MNSIPCRVINQTVPKETVPCRAKNILGNLRATRHYGWLACSLAGWLSGWVAGWMCGFLPASPAGCWDPWLAMASVMAAWLVAWLAAKPFRAKNTVPCRA